MGYVVGIDIGGTFTDCAVLDESGTVTTAKALSTPADFMVGVVNALANAAAKMGLRGADALCSQMQLFVHACTVAENTLLSDRAAQRVGLVTTAGFADTLAIMRGMAAKRVAAEEDLVTPELVFEVHERVDAEGEVLVPLGREEVASVLDQLVAAGATAVAVALLWSVVNDAHEQLVATVARERHPGLPVLLSSRVAPYAGEYERTATTVIGAHVSPKLAGYLRPLAAELARRGFPSEPLVMQAYGGAVGVEHAVERPVGVIESGPAAGVLGCAALGTSLGYPDVIVTDMGGTTFKVGLVSGGELSMDRSPVVLGHRLYAEKVRVESIGAGGGSIAWVDPETGLPKVGPRGAGADPGPVCYGLGGTEPTVADADLLLGYLDTGALLGGELRIDAEAARRAVEERIAGRLGIDWAAAAQGVYRIVNAHMADLVRRCTVAQGHDPREFTVFAIGGAAPMHAGSYCRDLGIARFVVPQTASVAGAFGLLVSDVLLAATRAVNVPLPADAADLDSLFGELHRQGLEDVAAYGIPAGAFVATRSVDAKYRYQANELRLDLGRAGEPITEDLVARLPATFEQLYERRFGQGSSYPGAEQVVISARVELRHPLPRPQLARAVVGSGAPGHPVQRRRVWFEGHGWVADTPVHRIADLVVGRPVKGPAILVDDVTTIVIDPVQTAERDPLSNVVVEVGLA